MVHYLCILIKFATCFVTEVIIGFTEQSFAVFEGDGDIEVCLFLRGFSTKPFTVHVSTRDGTAKGN